MRVLGRGVWSGFGVHGDILIFLCLGEWLVPVGGRYSHWSVNEPIRGQLYLDTVLLLLLRCDL